MIAAFCEPSTAQYDPPILYKFIGAFQSQLLDILIVLLFSEPKRFYQSVVELISGSCECLGLFQFSFVSIIH